MNTHTQSHRPKCAHIKTGTHPLTHSMEQTHNYHAVRGCCQGVVTVSLCCLYPCCSHSKIKTLFRGQGTASFCFVSLLLPLNLHCFGPIFSSSLYVPCQSLITPSLSFSPHLHPTQSLPLVPFVPCEFHFVSPTSCHFSDFLCSSLPPFLFFCNRFAAMWKG